MRCERLRAAGEPAALAAELRALVPGPASVREAVAEIIAEVRSRGDEALRDYTRRFDTGRCRAGPAAGRRRTSSRRPRADLDPDVRAGLEHAIHNVRRVAEAGLRPDATVQFDRHEVILRSSPVASAGVYVPGGRAPYPSTVVMGVVTARWRVSSECRCVPLRAATATFIRSCSAPAGWPAHTPSTGSAERRRSRRWRSAPNRSTAWT